MNKDQDRKQALLQNLQDAGCHQKLIDKFFNLLDQKQFDQIFILLRKYRNTLLDNIHKQQKEIDILDYLIMDLKKEDL
mgnify:CR=1 FL=1